MHRTGCIVHSYYNEAGCTVSGQDHICREWYFRMAVACQERIAYPVIVSGIFGLLWTVKHDGCRDSECIFVDILEMSEIARLHAHYRGPRTGTLLLFTHVTWGPAKTIDYN